MDNNPVKNLWQIPDLRNRVLFTLAMLGVYRIGNHIPTPGVNTDALALLADAQKNTMFGLYDMFSGGNLARVTIFALGIMPYISSSIILQLLTVVWPYLERLSKEGELGRRLAYLVSHPALAEVAETIGLADALSVSPGEDRAGVRQRATVLADALEAALGAVYLDGGLDPARAFVRRAWAHAMETLADPPKDAKSMLQEWAHKRLKTTPTYEVVERSGPAHMPVFTVKATAGRHAGIGTAGSKQAAEQAAARALLEDAGQ